MMNPTIQRNTYLPQLHLSYTHSLPNNRIRQKNAQMYTINSSKLHALGKIIDSNDVSLTPSDSNLDDDDLIQIGIIGPPHGVRGEFKVQPLTDFPEDRLGEPGTRWIQPPAPKFASRQPPPSPDEVTLEWGRQSISKGREVWLVKLQGIDSPEEASLIRGYTILIPATEREPLEDEDEFYVQELVGLHVYMLKANHETAATSTSTSEDGHHIGIVVDVFDGTGSHDVLRIELMDGIMTQRDEGSDAQNESNNSSSRSSLEREKYHVLLPFAKPLIPFVDVENKLMQITPPDGWLDLAVKTTKSAPRKESMGKRERRNPRGGGSKVLD